MPQLVKPVHPGARVPQREATPRKSPCTATREMKSPCVAMKMQESQNKKINQLKFFLKSRGRDTAKEIMPLGTNEWH